MMKRYLILEDGTVFEGTAFGGEGASVGEIVFNTSMTGYQEILSDPSYCGQIVTMTYPLIGNYGINSDDFESIEPAVKGMVVREIAEFPSNFRNNATLDELFKIKDIPGISGIDTRKLTRLIRSKGSIKGVLTAAGEDVQVEEVVKTLQATVLPSNQVSQVSTARPYPSPGRGKRVVLIDYGMKHGILRELNNRDCDVIVVPYNTSSKEILAWGPDGVMLSNGPGDPKDVEECVEVVRELLGEVPIFGICLGHQLFARACGADTFKLKFGHRGGNHPVRDLVTGKIEITSQNHGYAVDEETLQGTRLKVTHSALNDGTNEGLAHLDYPAFTVQYHPESSPGPEDSNYLFDRFIDVMNATRKEQQHA
ncbi:carbamoyl phosphate synthase small subunit [Planococcus sp. APC 3900]|uniref:Carbamoyl phosphate synthase small chain n=1 Tax=Planococcus notacanthi TaxID=3035188 RepID=A0ABT7ZG78_9BACL|nr:MULTISPECIES: carbamoyl phosphate synthase small subunit [unclassified Planococcus (in: firmicutes)]MDN3426092.1 carbamoyl phosphate synthase small subunit [Planococcus sp. APC 4016]MDN3437686.1 carbamoyl phosphate synthase small subunit [Planococcus sp. APC 3900]